MLLDILPSQIWFKDTPNNILWVNKAVWLVHLKAWWSCKSAIDFVFADIALARGFTLNKHNLRIGFAGILHAAQ